MQHHPELEASISIDGDGFQAITFQATGIQTYEVTFHGIGGHAQGAFAKIANPIHAAGRAIAKISEFRIPEGSETTFAVTNLEAGNVSAVHAIVSECTIRFNFRANVQEELEAGLPAICLGGGSGHDSRCHSEEEQFCEEGAFRGCQSAYLIALLCAGVAEVDSIIG